MKYEIRSIEAWREPDGGWYWNNSYVIGSLVFEEPTTRRILRVFREEGYLSEESKGRATVWTDGEMFEIQDRRTGEPVFALLPVDK